MAKPEQPKDIKPKTEGEAAPKAKKPIDENMKVIVINLATTVLICVLFLSVNYVLQASLLNSKLSQVTAGSEASAESGAEGDASAEEEVQKGLDSCKGYLKGTVSKTLDYLRRVPDLRFVYDESVEEGSRIEGLLSKLKG